MLKKLKNAVFYHIYPLGFCGALKNDSDSNIEMKLDNSWVKHLKEIGINYIYFGPVFQSTYHGYDTIDYLMIDERLGSDSEFVQLVERLHKNNIKVVVDGVFNHVGREFWAFDDVKKNKGNSKYLKWFNIDLGRNNSYNDGFFYEGWEGHYDLVKLNLNNPDVRGYLFDVVETWVKKYDIDGIRLDVAYLLPQDFIIELKNKCNAMSKEIWLMGEIIHGDYNSIVGENKLDSATNYEVYKGIYSSHNDKNYYEIAYSLNRQFGDGGIYKDMLLYNFVDNHDVNRIATMLKDKNHLYDVYTLLFMMPGIPAVYYGSEWAVEGDRAVTDLNLRPELNIDNYKSKKTCLELEKHISTLAEIRNNNEEIQIGGYKQILVTNKQFIFGRNLGDKWMYIALNLDNSDFVCELTINNDNSTVIDLLNGNNEYMVINKRVTIKIPPYSSKILK